MSECEDCKKSSDDVKVRHAMTAYHWDGKGEDPNRDMMQCDDCWEAYRQHWQGMWGEYYRSQGI